MAEEFKVVRYAIQFKRAGEIVTGKPIYSTLEEAKEGAKRDNAAHMTNSTKAVEIDLTQKVLDWAETIAYAAQHPDRAGDPQKTVASIVKLIQFTQRGY